MKNKLLICILLLGVFGVTAVHAKAAKEILIKQKDREFVRNGNKVGSLMVKPGDVIRFENADPFVHNVFSLSPLKKFDLGSYPKGQSKTVVYTTKGTAAIECAIHPHMFLEVTVE